MTLEQAASLLAKAWIEDEMDFVHWKTVEAATEWAQALTVITGRQFTVKEGPAYGVHGASAETYIWVTEVQS